MESHLSALRLATLEQRHFQLHSTALEQLTEHLNGLDALCRTLGVTPLSRFVDPTALEFAEASRLLPAEERGPLIPDGETDRKSTRLNSSHVRSSYAVFC